MGGPSWEVETGRRDGMMSILSEALTSLPSPSSNINSLKATFQQKGLSPKDLVVLSGINLQLDHLICLKTLFHFSDARRDGSSI